MLAKFNLLQEILTSFIILQVVTGLPSQITPQHQVISIIPTRSITPTQHNLVQLLHQCQQKFPLHLIKTNSTLVYPVKQYMHHHGRFNQFHPVLLIIITNHHLNRFHQHLLHCHNQLDLQVWDLLKVWFYSKTFSFIFYSCITQ